MSRRFSFLVPRQKSGFLVPSFPCDIPRHSLLQQKIDGYGSTHNLSRRRDIYLDWKIMLISHFSVSCFRRARCFCFSVVGRHGTRARCALTRDWNSCQIFSSSLGYHTYVVELPRPMYLLGSVTSKMYLGRESSKLYDGERSCRLRVDFMTWIDQPYAEAAVSFPYGSSQASTFSRCFSSCARRRFKHSLSIFPHT